ncbi:MAG: hypothetical protein M3452_09545 [Chloroflexota bacterium]|nr:hypothetical protein [Chloroflexota bacterium]
MDRRIVPIIRDPDMDPGQAASSLQIQALVVVTSDMNTRLRALGLVGQCEVSPFLASAETHLSDELKEGVGAILYDDQPPSTYEDWLEDVRRFLRVIEEEE